MITILTALFVMELGWKIDGYVQTEESRRLVMDSAFLVRLHDPRVTGATRLL